MAEEVQVGTIDRKTLRMLKERGLVTHFLAFISVFCDDEEGKAQWKIDRYMQWAAIQPEVEPYKKRPTQKQWVEKFRKHAPEFITEKK